MSCVVLRRISFSLLKWVRMTSLSSSVICNPIAFSLFHLIRRSVFFAIAHRYAFPHTDYIHYLQRNALSTPGKSRRGPYPETLFLFDQDHNVINDPNSVDIEYEPPTVRQLDRPMSVSRALMGVVPNETISDIARLVGGSGGAQGPSGGGDFVISRDHAEMI